MGILNLKKNKVAVVANDAPKKTKKLAVREEKTPAITGAAKHFDSSVLIRPRVTEKASYLSEGGRSVAVFEVSASADKRSVAAAVTGLYKAVPEKVSVIKIPAKRKLVRGRMTNGVTRYKAYVYLKVGDKIDTV